MQMIRRRLILLRHLVVRVLLMTRTNRAAMERYKLPPRYVVMGSLRREPAVDIRRRGSAPLILMERKEALVRRLDRDPRL